MVAAMTITTTISDHPRPAPSCRRDCSRASAPVPATLDRANAYFDEDLAELRAIGYLAAAVPAAPRRVGPRPGRAGRQPAPPGPLRAGDGPGDDHALATGSASPPSWTGPATRRCAGSSRPPSTARSFAAGHAEAGNDIPVLLSTCQAERVDGGYRLTGRKQFGSNGPAWTLARRPRHRRRRARRPADRARLRRAHQPGRHRGGDLGHAGHAPDPEPRHGPRRRVRPRRPHRPGRARRRRQRPVPRRHGHVAAVAHRRRLPRASPTGRSSWRSTAPAARRRWRSSEAPTPTTRWSSTRSPRCTSSSTPPRRPSSGSSTTGWPASTTATPGCRRSTR